MTRWRRLRAIARRLRDMRPGSAGERCRVCRSRDLVHRDLTYVVDPRKTCSIRRCVHCGYVAILRSEESLWKERTKLGAGHGSVRIGTHDRVGREFHIAKMAVDILGRDKLSVLMYGAGAGLDNVHVERLEEVRRVAIGDIMKVRDDADFVDLTQPAREQFDIVIASEVVEHFRNPRPDFDRLFGFVQGDGLIVAATNIHTGNDLARDHYVFFPDHTSYYSPRALRKIANDAGFHVDFRAPLIGQRMRKRYVFFSRSSAVLEDVACYFGTEVYAPSEVARAIRPPAQRSHAAWRPEPEDS